MSSTLEGRTALVTGSSRGVGRAIALRLAAQGAAVAVNYRKDESAAQQVVKEIHAAGGSAVAYQASIGDLAAVEAMVDAVRSDLGPVSIVVSNAGTASRGSTVADTDPAEYASQMQVHAFGPIGLIRAVLPDLRAGSRGDIVMVSSNTAASAPANAAPYTMAKAAMETCVRTIAREERANGVHANIVAPGLVATDMGRRLVKASTDNSIDDLDASAPFGRVCRPEDVAGAVAYLVSADASYLTGQTLYIDGGGPDASIF
ncbi:NAD(P)-dependent dehydrogenase (short-subunit alcohol dehydrogenase family) [Arthrobacter sp. SLBN-100]|uniref:SDR family NAD(P)-dependent oxidoreductase n=1 Tax=Arthrobacter sp. SLBN-100 TaxID=2768450 RepID=UPI00115190D7|nr:SDR family oxidoreductase [Arthrobacter sp. SLBN-100]TQJ62225.1 NAD(P)-dependent dehydrogenase (short-subunit alcohol dehydrogenase family) [Arthrobacter sp. SLBN-100]